MKLVPLLLFVAMVALVGCNTPNTRRTLYHPSKQQVPGPDVDLASRENAGKAYWTKQWEEGERPMDNVAKPGPESGFFGISHPPYSTRSRNPGPGPDTGIFGISRPRGYEHYYRP